MNPDLESWRNVFSGLMGGVFMALVHLAATLLNGQVPTRRDFILAAFNVLFMIVAGGLAAHFLTDVVAQNMPLASMRAPKAVGFMIGAVAWVGAPGIMSGLAKRLARKAEGGQ